MANQLSMAKINAIQTLHQSGHSNRKIAKLLGVDRGTVGKYAAAQNLPSAPTGSEPASPHQPGPPSACQPFLDVIRGKLDQGLSAQRIFQDLRCEHGFTGSYYSVRRLFGEFFVGGRGDQGQQWVEYLAHWCIVVCCHSDRKPSWILQDYILPDGDCHLAVLETSLAKKLRR